MKEFRYVVCDKEGIHARPAGQFIKEAMTCGCDVTLKKGEKEVNAKQILGVMGLGVKQGEEIILRTSGEGEEEAMEKLSKFVQENF